MVPFLLAGMFSRRRLIQWSLAEFIRPEERSSTARECPDLLNEVLQSFLDARSKASTTGAKTGFSGWTEGSRRRRRMFSALGIKWRAPVTCWLLAERARVLKKAGGGLEGKIGIGLVFWQNRG